MVKLENFQEHLQSLNTKDWNKLFVLLPFIENFESFGDFKNSEKLDDGSITFPYWQSSEIVNKTLSVIYELSLMPIFDWMSWEEGSTILNNSVYNYSKLDNITLCKLLTAIIRADRFNEGTMNSFFNNGVIAKIIKNLHKNITLHYKIKSTLFGVAVGDAVGVPVEFESRQTISKNPVTDMKGYGTYHLPPGTWSDDSSLTFCLAEALTQNFNLNIIGNNFVNWAFENYWTARGTVFDIGIATRQAIARLSEGVQPDLAGGFDASSNGNGSLMRISPLLFYVMDKPINERYEIIKQVSSITHGHTRSVIACFYYLEYARHLFAQKDKFIIYKDLQTEVTNHLSSISINPAEIALFDRLLKQNIYELSVDDISSTGYVLHTLEASIWCLLTTENYEDAVLKAVNLGEDTDTISAVTGGLAGLLYGWNEIPTHWMKQIAKIDEIENLAERLGDKIASS